MRRKSLHRAAVAFATAAALSVLTLSGTAQARQGAPCTGYGKTNDPNAGVW